MESVLCHFCHWGGQTPPFPFTVLATLAKILFMSCHLLATHGWGGKPGPRVLLTVVSIIVKGKQCPLYNPGSATFSPKTLNKLPALPKPQSLHLKWE